MKTSITSVQYLRLKEDFRTQLPNEKLDAYLSFYGIYVTQIDVGLTDRQIKLLIAIQNTALARSIRIVDIYTMLLNSAPIPFWQAFTNYSVNDMSADLSFVVSLNLVKDNKDGTFQALSFSETPTQSIQPVRETITPTLATVLTSTPTIVMRPKPLYHPDFSKKRARSVSEDNFPQSKQIRSAIAESSRPIASASISSTFFTPPPFDPALLPLLLQLRQKTLDTLAEKLALMQSRLGTPASTPPLMTSALFSPNVINSQLAVNQEVEKKEIGPSVRANRQF